MRTLYNISVAHFLKSRNNSTHSKRSLYGRSQMETILKKKYWKAVPRDQMQTGCIVANLY